MIGKGIMEGIIVCVIVGLAGLWAGSRLFGRGKASACSMGCAGCSPANRPQPLVQIRR
jgi:hypothetical protein